MIFSIHRYRIKNVKKKISSKRIQPTGFWTVHFIEALFCDCSCVPFFRIIAFMFHVMRNYPKSLQELSRRKSWEKVGIVQSPSAKKTYCWFSIVNLSSGIVRFRLPIWSRQTRIVSTFRCRVLQNPLYPLHSFLLHHPRKFFHIHRFRDMRIHSGA